MAHVTWASQPVTCRLQLQIQSGLHDNYVITSRKSTTEICSTTYQTINISRNARNPRERFEKCSNLCCNLYGQLHKVKKFEMFSLFNVDLIRIRLNTSRPKNMLLSFQNKVEVYSCSRIFAAVLMKKLVRTSTTLHPESTRFTGKSYLIRDFLRGYPPVRGDGAFTVILVSNSSKLNTHTTSALCGQTRATSGLTKR